MNISSRETLNEKETKFLPDGERIKVPRYVDIKPFISVGASKFYTAIAKFDGKNGVKAGDLVYFKANSTRGVNGNTSRTDEARGSCEDVAEVFGFYLLKNLRSDLGDEAVLDTTPYDFADYSSDDLWKLVSKQTAGLIESSRLYGCLSKDCLGEGVEIIHGHVMLRQALPEKVSLVSSQNNLFNYEQSLIAFAQNAKTAGQEVVINPISSRYQANTILWDYFIGNADRHCKNVNYQKVPLVDGRFVLEPTKILDNGGGFAMQIPRCYDLYVEQLQEFEKYGKLLPYTDSVQQDGTVAKISSPFKVTYDFTVGKEVFKDDKIASIYDSLSQEQQIVLLVSQNKTLFNDLRNMYTHLDTERAYGDMQKETRYPTGFLPGFEIVTREAIQMKKLMMSQIMAEVLGEEFDEQAFNENQTYYLDKFEQLVKDDELNLHIATNEEVKQFKQEIENLKIHTAQKQ